METILQNLFGLSEKNSSFAFYALLAVGAYLLLRYVTTPRTPRTGTRPLPRSSRPSGERPPPKNGRLNRRGRKIEEPQFPNSSKKTEGYQAPDDYYSNQPQGPLGGPRDDVDYRAPSNRSPDPYQTDQQGGEIASSPKLTGLHKFLIVGGLMFLMASTGYGGYIPLLFLGAIFFMGRKAGAGGGLGGLLKKILGNRGLIVILGYIVKIIMRGLRR